MSRKAIRDLVGGALLVATALLYFWVAHGQRTAEGATTSPEAIESVESRVPDGA